MKNLLKREGWFEWQTFGELEKKFSMVPKSPGAYIIAFGRPINRCEGVDNEGILDIGESENLFLRLKCFFNCATDKNADGHMAGWRYNYLNYGEKFPIRDLYVAWLVLISKDAAVNKEGELLKIYVG